MGYSNNKWRKILTILMIINLCFILFAKITKVFGSFSVTYEEYTINITDSLIDNSPYYAIFVTEDRFPSSPYFCLVRSNSPIKLRLNTTGATRLIAYNTNENGIDMLSSQGIGFVNDLENTTFTTPSYNGRDVSVSGIPSNWSCIVTNHDIYSIDNENDLLFPNNTTITPFFTNNTEIEQCSFTDGIYINPGDFENTDTIYFHLLEITNGLANGDTSLYYYNDKIFALDKDSTYYRTYADIDPDSDLFYYYIPRYKLGLSQNTSYLYVLNNSKTQIQNSNGVIEKDAANGIYDVVESDTTGVITATEEENDRMKNIQSSIIENQETTNNINNSLTNTTVTNETQTDIDTNLNFNNSAPQFSTLFNGFFSRLTSTISDLGNYQDTDVITVYLPIPFTNSTIPISSDFIFSNQNNPFLRNITVLLWYFIFGRYFLFFLIKTYWLITNGQFFKFYLTQKEAITSDVL